MVKVIFFFLGVTGITVVAIFGLMRDIDKEIEPVPGMERAELHDACERAPTTVESREVRRYRGTVGEPPPPSGRWGTPTRPDGVIPTIAAKLNNGFLIVRVVDGDEDLVVQHRLSDPPPAGTQLAFCAVSVGEIHFWPQTGYQPGLFGGVSYGPPEGPYLAVRWIQDTNS